MKLFAINDIDASLAKDHLEYMWARLPYRYCSKNVSGYRRHPISVVAYSVQLVLLNKHQISGGGACLNSYLDTAVFPQVQFGCRLPGEIISSST